MMSPVRNKIYDCTPDFKLREKFIGEMLSYKSLEILSSSFDQALSEPDALAILVTPEDSRELLPRFPNRSQDIDRLEIFDTVFFVGGRFWPFCLYRNVFREIVYDKCPALNTRLRCYLAGEHPLLLPAIEAFSVLGISKFCWITRNQDSVREFIRRAQAIFIGLQIEIMKQMELTLQANNGSVVINGIIDPEESELLDDLAYLNFLDHPGFIVDLETSTPVDWGVTGDAQSSYPKAGREDLRRFYDSVLLREIRGLIANKTLA